MSKQNRKLLSPWWGAVRVININFTYQNTDQKEECSCNVLLQKTKNSNVLQKKCTQEKFKCYIQHQESWSRWIVIEQVNDK